MKVNDRFVTLEKQADTQKRLNAAGKNAAAKPAKSSSSDSKSVVTASGTDTLQLSSRTLEVADIAMQLKESSEVKSEKVAELREKIANGTYFVSGADIASKIVEKAAAKLF